MRILYVTTVGGTMSFFPRLVGELIGDGHTVDIATNESLSPVPDCYRKWGCTIYQISCTRSPLEKSTLKAVKEIKKIVSEGGYDIVHCHTPVAAMCTRLACRKLRKDGLKVFYTAHGFHFCKGAPLKNWLLYYPVEWICAWMTDVLITINEEDYALAKKHMHAKRVEYVPGVGIDLEKFKPLSDAFAPVTSCDTSDAATGDLVNAASSAALRESLGIRDGDTVFVSVGELNKDKNHILMIKALERLKRDDYKYIVCGTGALKEYLTQYVRDAGLDGQVKLLGFRSDIAEILKIADVFVFPTSFEGLPVSLMEAIATKVIAICSDGRGMRDLVKDERCLFNWQSVDGLIRAIENVTSMSEKERQAIIEDNYSRLLPRKQSRVLDKMSGLYDEIAHRGGAVAYLEKLRYIYALRESFGIAYDEKMLLSVGELNANKNHEAVIRALAKTGDGSLHYVIAGTGEYKDALEELARELGVAERVHIPGFRDDVTDLYRAADVFVLPSLREGLPVSLMEAIATKVIAICSDRRGMTDIVKDERFLFDPKSEDEIARAIENAVSVSGDVRREVIEDNYSRLLDRTDASVAKRMREIYASVS